MLIHSKTYSDYKEYKKVEKVVVKKAEVKKVAVKKVDSKKQLINKINSTFKVKEVETIVNHIYKVSNLLKSKYDINVKPYEIAAIIAVESGFNKFSHNKTTNAKGLMQITPICIKSVEQQTGVKINNPFSIKENIFVGSYYYGINKKKYGTEMALVVYNAGYKNSRKRLIVSRGNERSYLRKVIKYFEIFK